MRGTFLKIICFFAIIVAIIFFFLQEKSVTTDNAFIVATTASPYVELRQVPDSWQEYRNVTYNFSLLYPKNLNVNEHPEGEGATTVTFQNVEKGEGFQIFILPYAKPQVSEERFKKDIPSGVRSNLTDIVIGEANGAAFYSKDALLGETREVWFIHDGYLYEVTTLKSLDTWLDKIINSWKFL